MWTKEVMTRLDLERQTYIEEKKRFKKVISVEFL